MREKEHQLQPILGYTLPHRFIFTQIATYMHKIHTPSKTRSWHPRMTVLHKVPCWYRRVSGGFPLTSDIYSSLETQCICATLLNHRDILRSSKKRLFDPHRAHQCSIFHLLPVKTSLSLRPALKTDLPSCETTSQETRARQKDKFSPAQSQDTDLKILGSRFGGNSGSAEPSYLPCQTCAAALSP